LTYRDSSGVGRNSVKMARVVITIHPTVSDERLLSVADAMQQVLDHIKLFEDAQQAMGDPHTRLSGS